MLIPADTEITITAVYDNSELKDTNPDPTVEVHGGIRTEDEMAQIYLEFTLPDERLELLVKDGIVSVSEEAG